MPMHPLHGQHEGQEYIITSAPLINGVINRFHRRALPEGAAQELLNVDLTDPMVPCKRDGYEAIDINQQGIDAGLLNSRPGGLAWFNPSQGDRFLVLSMPSAGAGKLYKTVDVTSIAWGEIVTADGDSIDMGGDDLVAFQANDRLWMLPGLGGFVTVVGIDGVAIKTTEAADDAPGGAIDGCYMLNRVFLLFGASIAWSILLPVTPVGGFDQTTQKLTMSPNRGARPVALRAWRDSNLIVFFDLTIEEMIVDPSDVLASQRNVIEPAIGCCSRASVVPLGDDFYFADQWGQVRSLKRSDLGSNNGVIASPLSEPIKGEIPGRINKQALNRIRLVVMDDHLDVYYPRDDALEANARMTYEFASQSWHGPHVFAHPVGQLVVSNIRERGEELFSTNGATGADASADVFLWNQGGFTDNGTAIEYRETTRSMDFEFPELTKRWNWLEAEFYGSEGATPEVSVRVQEDGEFSAPLTLTSGSESVQGQSDFPLVPDDFPLTPDDFPLTSTPAGTARARFQLDSDVARRGRCLEVRIAEGSSGLAFQRRGYRLVAEVQKFEANPTDDVEIEA